MTSTRRGFLRAIPLLAAAFGIKQGAKPKRKLHVINIADIGTKPRFICQRNAQIMDVPHGGILAGQMVTIDGAGFARPANHGEPFIGMAIQNSEPNGALHIVS